MAQITIVILLIIIVLLLIAYVKKNLITVDCVTINKTFETILKQCEVGACNKCCYYTERYFFESGRDVKRPCCSFYGKPVTWGCIEIIEITTALNIKTIEEKV